ncbi:MAG: DUF342 domain-containing protein [Planctomycetes bacterium]|nr:DUF342 domain-containing protein [Planctomycetota bacterium]
MPEDDLIQSAQSESLGNPEARPVTSMSGPKGKRINVRVMVMIENANCRARVLADLDFMKAYLHYTRIKDGHLVSPAELRDIVRQSGIHHGIDDLAFHFLADLLNTSGKPVGPFEIARGVRPRRGEDARLELTVRATSREPAYEMDDDGNIDYKRLNLFDNVVKGQKIAVLKLPTRGNPGTNILGESMPAADGKNISVRLGKNVSSDKDNMTFYADMDGRVEGDATHLSVETTYEVHGNIDYNVGHVDFIGTVIVNGNVLDEFNVSGRGGVSIRGQVGNSNIFSEKCVEILGGMTGRGVGSILAGESVIAKYLNDVTVECRGDVVVNKEIVGCNIRTTGRIKIERGTIIGGNVTAFRGIHADNIGSELGVTTRVSSGIDWTLQEKIDKINAVIEDLGAQIELINQDLQPMMESKGLLLKMSKEQKEGLQELIGKLRDMRDEMEKAEGEREMLESKVQRGQVSQINVNNLLHPGTIARFRHTQKTFKDAFRGPLSVVEDREKECVRVLNQFQLFEDDSPERPWLGGIKDVPSKSR